MADSQQSEAYAEHERTALDALREVADDKLAPRADRLRAGIEILRYLGRNSERFDAAAERAAQEALERLFVRDPLAQSHSELPEPDEPAL